MAPPRLLMSLEEQTALRRIVLLLKGEDIKDKSGNVLERPPGNLAGEMKLLSELNEFIFLMADRTEVEKPQTQLDEMLLIRNLFIAKNTMTGGNDDKQSTYISEEYLQLQKTLNNLISFNIDPSRTDSDSETEDADYLNSEINRINPLIIERFKECVKAYKAYLKADLSAHKMIDIAKLEELISITDELNSPETTSLLEEVKRLKLLDVVASLSNPKNTLTTLQNSLVDLKTVMTLLEKTLGKTTETPPEHPTITLVRFMQLSQEDRNKFITALLQLGKSKDPLTKEQLSFYHDFQKNPIRDEYPDAKIVFDDKDKLKEFLELTSGLNIRSIQILNERIARFQIWECLKFISEPKSLRMLKKNLIALAELLADIESRLLNKPIQFDGKQEGYPLLLKYLDMSAEERVGFFSDLHGFCHVEEFNTIDGPTKKLKQINIFNQLKNASIPEKNNTELFSSYLEVSENHLFDMVATLQILLKSKNVALIKEQIKSCEKLLKECKDKESIQAVSSRLSDSTKNVMEFIDQFMAYTHFLLNLKPSDQDSFKKIEDSLKKAEDSVKKIKEEFSVFYKLLEKKSSDVDEIELRKKIKESDQQVFADKIAKLDDLSEKLTELPFETMSSLLENEMLLAFYENLICSFNTNKITDLLADTNKKISDLTDIVDLQKKRRAIAIDFIAECAKNYDAFRGIEAILPLLETIDTFLEPRFKTLEPLHATRFRRLNAFLPDTNPDAMQIKKALEMRKSEKDILEVKTFVTSANERAKPQKSTHHNVPLSALFAAPQVPALSSASTLVPESKPTQERLKTSNQGHARAPSQTLSSDKAGDIATLSPTTHRKAGSPTINRNLNVPSLPISSISSDNSGDPASTNRSRSSSRAKRPTEKERREGMATNRTQSLSARGFNHLYQFVNKITTRTPDEAINEKGKEKESPRTPTSANKRK